MFHLFKAKDDFRQETTCFRSVHKNDIVPQYYFIILISVLTLFIHTYCFSVSETNSAGLDKLWYCES